jgi:hypothetical protein
VVENRHTDTDKRFAFSETYEPRVTPRRVWSAFLALGVITVVGVLGYILFEGWNFVDALYMTVIALTTV